MNTTQYYKYASSFILIHFFLLNVVRTWVRSNQTLQYTFAKLFLSSLERVLKKKKKQPDSEAVVILHLFVKH